MRTAKKRERTIMQRIKYWNFRRKGLTLGEVEDRVRTKWGNFLGFK